ncbi:Transcription factor iws1 [Malassezia sp. CBS 17886]|nr:Transcription factor iws1 [Malassezia sp. CBS 17886]
MTDAEPDHRDIFGGASDEEHSDLDDVHDAPAEHEALEASSGHGTDTLPVIPRREVDATEIGAAPKKKKKTAHPGDEDAGAPTDTVEGTAQDDSGPTGRALLRAQIDAQIDAALKTGKRRGGRRRVAGEDDLELMADEEVSALNTEMNLAADEDEDANRLRQPATAKLRLLPRVVSTLQKSHLQQAILDNNLLEGVKRWLEPLPDKSLPALNIQKQLFAVLEGMTIDTISLKMSGLGRVVVFYSMCKRVETPIQRSAEHLIEVWTRPIMKRSASYRDRQVAHAEWSQNSPHNPSSRVANVVGNQDAARRHVSIPQTVTSGFRVAPKTRPEERSNDHDHRSRVANTMRLNRFKSRLKEANARR